MCKIILYMEREVGMKETPEGEEKAQTQQDSRSTQLITQQATTHSRVTERGRVSWGQKHRGVQQRAET